MDLFSSIPQHPLLSTLTELTIRGMMRERAGQKFVCCENKIFRSLARLACDKSILLLAHERSILKWNWKQHPFSPLEYHWVCFSLSFTFSSLLFFFSSIHCFSLSTSCRKISLRRRWKKETRNHLRCSMLSKQIKFYGKYIKKMFDWRLAKKKATWHCRRAKFMWKCYKF